MTKNATNTILMVRPIRFGMNAQTAVDNFYQQQDAATDSATDNAKAQAEFDTLVSKLRAAGVEVLVIQDNELS
ncbi:MAG TPA: amidinotransferase, partial [Cryomorphaceae bacterium]|nr:amidinotransferase [Cryomorphaceae bacterium]